jgi:hypothetical protein
MDSQHYSSSIMNTSSKRWKKVQKIRHRLTLHSRSRQCKRWALSDRYQYSLTSRLEASTSVVRRLRSISVDCARILPRLNCPWEGAVASLVRNELDPSTVSDVLLKSYLSLFIRRVKSGATVQQIYIEFEMGCKMVADHADDTPRVAKLIVSIFTSGFYYIR